MLRFRASLLLGIVFLLVAGGLGCSRRPRPPKWPKLKPAQAARKAMEQYDTNRDGKLDAEELKQSPPLADAMIPFEWEDHSPIDANGDGELTEKEIRERMAAWLRGHMVVCTQSTAVTLDGKDLEGATVTYEPEEFLGPAVQPTSDVTGQYGYCYPPGQDEKFPGIYIGLYRVRISKIVDGKETIPERYNTKTILGKEIADDAPSTHRLLEYRLTSD